MSTGIAAQVGTAIPAVGAVPIVAASLPAAITTPIATIAGSIAPLAILAAPLLLPAIASLIAGPRRPGSIFRMESAIPPGVSLDVFGIFPAGAKSLNGGLWQFIPGNRPRQQIRLSPVGAFTNFDGVFLNFATRSALSFDPATAAEGEAAIREYVDRPFPRGSPTARDVRQQVQRGGFVRGTSFAQRAEIVLDQRVEAARVRRAAALKRAQEDSIRVVTRGSSGDIWKAVRQACAIGALPGCQLSTAAAAAGLGITPAPIAAAPVAPIEVLQTQLAQSQQFGASVPDFIRNREARQAQRASIAVSQPEVIPVGNITTSIPVTGGAGGFLGGFGSALAGLGTGLGSIISAAAPLVPSILQATTGRTAVAMPGGAQIPGVFQDPRILQAQQAAFGLDLPSLVPDFLGAIPTTGGACITPTARSSVRLPSRVDVPTVDASGNTRFTTFKNMGKPILWSGDLAACKRVKRLGSRVRRAGGR